MEPKEQMRKDFETLTERFRAAVRSAFLDRRDHGHSLNEEVTVGGLTRVFGPFRVALKKSKEKWGSSPDYRSALEALRVEVRDFEFDRWDQLVGTSYQSPLMNQDATDAMEVLRMEVLQDLRELVPEKVQNPITPMEWKGDVQMLAWLFKELAEKGWVEAPRHPSETQNWKEGQVVASRFAQLVASHFKNVNAGSLENVLKPGGKEPPAQDTEEWIIPKRLK